jgi:hypothetical protein
VDPSGISAFPREPAAGLRRSPPMSSSHCC